MGDVFLNKKPEAEDCEYVYAEDSTGAVVRVKKDSIIPAVQYTAQELTEEQQTQARSNIGAASEAAQISMAYDEENKIVRFFRGGVTVLELPATLEGEYFKLLTDETLTESGVPADAETVGKIIANLKAQEVQKTPLFPEENDTVENALDWLTENGDTSKVYVLPDGYIYAYKKFTGANYTNLADPSSEEWLTDYRLSTSSTSALSGCYVTNYIPCKLDDVIRIKGLVVAIENSLMGRFHLVDSSKAKINADDGYVYQLINSGYCTVDGDETKVIAGYCYTIDTIVSIPTIAYVRFCGPLIDGYTIDDIVITVNEEIAEVTEYKWGNTGLAFIPADYEDRIVDLEETTADHEARLQTLEQYAHETIDVPAYWLEELETKADVIQVAMENAGWNKSSFLYYTDAHWDAGNSKMSPLLLKYLFVNTSMNKTKFGGDILGDPLELTHDTVKHLYDEWRALIKELNQDSTLGNHDNLHKGRNDSDVANIVYSFLLAPEEKPNRVMGGDFYYYVDEPCEKTRYLHLDSGRYSLSDEETEFIIETLKSTPDGWHIVVISHIWFQYTSASEPSVGSMNPYMQKALDLFDAYNARESGSVTMVSTTYSYDFTDAGGKVEFCMGGHIHIDLDLFSTGGIPVILTASDVNQDRSSDEDEDSGTLGTITESAVYGIIADYDNSKITVVGVGRGGSREITLS